MARGAGAASPAGMFQVKAEIHGDTMTITDTITPGSPIAVAHPDLSGVQYPTDIGAALFEQKRERNGGLVDIEFKPNDALTLDLSGFSSRLLASNYNRNYLLWSTHFVASGAGQAPNPGYVVQDNTLTSATFAPVAGTAPAQPGHARHRQLRRALAAVDHCADQPLRDRSGNQQAVPVRDGARLSHLYAGDLYRPDDVLRGASGGAVVFV